jgi:hypothetical protein
MSVPPGFKGLRFPASVSRQNRAATMIHGPRSQRITDAEWDQGGESERLGPRPNTITQIAEALGLPLRVFTSR